jgi:cytochrome-b5 reductase
MALQISGGTGITPFYQLLHSLISSQNKSSKNTRFTLLHSSRTPADLPPPNILDTLSTFASQHPAKFRLHLFVDSVDGSSSQSFKPELQVGLIGKPAIERSLGLQNTSHRPWWNKIFSKPEVARPLPNKILFLVCGPEP